MSAVALPLGERLADWAGPLVVKELRLGLKSRAFGVAFGLMLLSGFVVTVSNALMTRNADSGRGAWAAAGCIAAYAVYGHLLVPFITYRAMVREREDETWVLLVLTGLGTPGIVRGKALAAVAQLALGFSATVPFVLMSYLLSGIDVPTLVLATFWHLGLSVFLTLAALGLAAQSDSRIERTAGHLLVLVFSAALGVPSFALTSSLVFRAGRLMASGESIGFLIGIPVALLLLATCVLPAAAAALALETEVRTHVARQRLAGVVAVCLSAVCAAPVVLGADEDVASAASVPLSLVLLVAGFFAFSELPGYPAGSASMGFARPGAFRSAAVVLGLLGLTALATGLVTGIASHRTMGLALAAPSYVALYLSLGVLLARLTPLARLGPRYATRLGFAIATTLGIVGLTLVSVIADERADKGPGWLLNPMFGMVRFASRGNVGFEAVVLFGIAALVSVVALLMLFAEDEVRTHAR